MEDQNPYKPSEIALVQPVSTATRSSLQWAVVGFLVGASIPIVLMIYSSWADAAYTASLPEDEVRCGMERIAAIGAIIVGVPMLGCVGALIGFVLSKLLPRGL